jgi:hypothetical protein
MGMPRLLNDIDALVSEGRLYFAAEDNARLVTVLRHVARYYKFLLVIYERYQEASNGLQRGYQQLIQSSDTGDTSRNFYELDHLSMLVQIEIESYYLFAKVLLDKVAHLFEFYFGQGRGLSLDSHDDLAKNLVEYCKVKHISHCDTLVGLVGALKKDVSDFRDYQIAHEKSPRTLHVVGFANAGDANANATIHLTRMNPREKDAYKMSKPITGLHDDIEAYIQMMVGLLRDNREVSILKALPNKPLVPTR